MKRKVFYTIHSKKCGLKIEEKSGFEIVAGGRMFNAYRNENSTVYIIDPESGRSVFTRNRDELSEVEAIESVREELIENDFVMEAVEKKMQTKDYMRMTEVFRMLKQGIEMERGRHEKPERKIWDYFSETIAWFFFIWISVLAVTCTYIFPGLGISILIIAIVLNFIQRICEKFKEGRKHESTDHMAAMGRNRGSRNKTQ